MRRYRKLLTKVHCPFPLGSVCEEGQAAGGPHLDCEPGEDDAIGREKLSEREAVEPVVQPAVQLDYALGLGQPITCCPVSLLSFLAVLLRNK